MNQKQFDKYLARDFGRCWHCGLDDDTLVPQHRAGRGMGSVKSRHTPSNIIVLCSWMNGAIESDHRQADFAKRQGWKLQSWQDPLNVPVFDTRTNEWKMLDDSFGVTVVEIL